MNDKGVYEAYSRHRKAVVLADVLDAAGADPTTLTEMIWQRAEKAADVRHASQRTRFLVVEMLIRRTKLRDGDPFEGLD